MTLNIKNLDNVPQQPGVYFFYGRKNSFIYIGKAKNLKKRLAQYFSVGSVWKQEMLQEAKSFDFQVVQSEKEAIFLEENLIRKHRPKFNNLIRGEHSYVYVKITPEPYPEIFLTRYKTNDGALYLGPKNNTGNLRTMLQYFKMIFQWRGCKNTQFRQAKLCSEFLFGMCKGWCVIAKMKQKNFEEIYQSAQKIGMKLTEDELYYREKSQNFLNAVADFFSGNTQPVKDLIKLNIEEAVKSQFFERANKLKQVYIAVDDFTQKQTIVLKTQLKGVIIFIAQIENTRFAVAMNFFDGNMIDLIRHRETTDDQSLEDVQALFEREFGKIKWSKVGSDFIKKHKTPQISKWKLGFSGKEIELDDEERNSLFDLANRSIDSMIMSTAYEKESLLGQLLESLQSRYSFKNFPYSVECIDISHLGGEFTAGAVVSMVNGIINKKGYRKYKLTDVNGDDYKAMEELLVRKLYHLDTEKASLPDLIILDGGKGQLGIIKTLITQSKKFAEISNYTQFASLGKGKARGSKGKNAGFNEKLYVLSHDLEITEHDIKYDEADRLLTKLRDEAHRFSNAYRTKMDSMRFRE